MSMEQDIAWLDALAGRSQHPGEPSPEPDVMEALALRELIRSQEPETQLPEVPEVDLQRERQLLERARAAGLLPATRVQSPWIRRGALAAAAVVVAAIGMTLFRSALEPTPVFRGGGTVHVQARDPAALKQQLASELSAAGAHVTGFERLGRPGIDVDLPQPLTPQVRQILERHHLPTPADGELTIEFESAGQP
jgi:hypothetical protein